MLKKLLFFTTTLILTGCGFTTTSTTNEKITFEGTIIENPSQLAEQTEFLLVNDENSTLAAYIHSTDVVLNNLVDQTGTLEGKAEEYTVDHIPRILVEKFTPNAPLSLEDILKQTTLREARKAPYSYGWNKKTSMLVLQNDNTNGSAQIKVNADDKEFLVKLVKREQEWHIAEIIKQEYSPLENSDSSTGSGSIEEEEERPNT